MDRERLLEVLVKANEFKEGDMLVGGTRDEIERLEARRLLGKLSLSDISSVAVVEDAVTETLGRAASPLGADISRMSVDELKRTLLAERAAQWVRRYGDGLASEAIAAVVKLMTNEELSVVSRHLFNPLPGKGIAIGSEGHFGSRIQPNSPGDDEEEILFSILEGLTYGCGDVILGVNPASDDLQTIVRLEKLLQGVQERLVLPVRYCVLSDIVKQTSARAQTRVEVGFQSLAGTSKALQGMVGLDADGLLDLARGFDGLYFETGQGSAVTNQTAEGVDMVTLEARNYGLVRHIRRQTGAWTIVNDVAGFIGPEVFQNGSQLLRACLEDTVMAKLHGLTMGLDVCSTFHMGIDPPTLRRLTVEAALSAAPAYLMSVAGNADPMLGYLTTSFREHPRLRRETRKRIASPMRERLTELGVMGASGALIPGRPAVESLYALYKKEGGDKRSTSALEKEGGRKLALLRERGFDLGYGHGDECEAPPGVEARMAAIFEQARRALYSIIDESVLRDAAPRNLRVRTMASSRDEYLAHPPRGERIREKDAARVASLHGSPRTPQVQIVISDGLNAKAVNENLRALLPRLRRLLSAEGLRAGATEIVVEYGRVRAGYHIGELLRSDLIVHIIGERPGTGLDTLSAYLTYGRDTAGRPRWDPAMDHSTTNAVCGIHFRGKHPKEAAEEIAALAAKIFRERRSGVELGWFPSGAREQKFPDKR